MTSEPTGEVAPRPSPASRTTPEGTAPADRQGGGAASDLAGGEALGGEALNLSARARGSDRSVGGRAPDGGGEATVAVVTSVDPRCPDQVRAFLAWRRLEVQVRTVNPPAEHAALLAAGLVPEEIVATGKARSCAAGTRPAVAAGDAGASRTGCIVDGADVRRPAAEAGGLAETGVGLTEADASDGPRTTEADGDGPAGAASGGGLPAAETGDGLAAAEAGDGLAAAEAGDGLAAAETGDGLAAAETGDGLAAAETGGRPMDAEAGHDLTESEAGRGPTGIGTGDGLTAVAVGGAAEVEAETRGGRAEAEAEARPALLSILAAAPRADIVVIARPDAYPALHPAALALVTQVAPITLLMAEGCDLVEAHALSERAPRREVLAAVVLRGGTGGTGSGADALARPLARFAAAWRVPFASRGADLLLTALIRSPAVGGRAMEAGILLVERAGTAEEPIPPAVVGALRQLGTRAVGARAAAAEVDAAVASDCVAAAHLTDLLRRTGYARPAFGSASVAGLAVAAELSARSPTVRWTVPFNALAALADRVLAGEAGRARIDALLLGRSGAANRAAEVAAATLLERLCQAVARDAGPSGAVVRAAASPAPDAVGTRLGETPGERRGR